MKATPQTILRSRAIPYAMIQFRTQNGEVIADPHPFDAIKVPEVVRYLHHNFTHEGKIRPDALEKLGATGLQPEVIKDNLSTVITMEAILQDILDVAGEWPDMNTMAAIYGYLLETGNAMPKEQLIKMADRWDVKDLQSDLQALSKKHGFKPTFALQWELTLFNDAGHAPVVPRVAAGVYAPLTYGHWEDVMSDAPILDGKVPQFVK